MFSKTTRSTRAHMEVKEHAFILLRLKLSEAYHRWACPYLTCVRRHRELGRAVLNSGGGETRPFAGHAEDSLHLIDCCAVSTLPRRQRRTEGRQRRNKRMKKLQVKEFQWTVSHLIIITETCPPHLDVLAAAITLLLWPLRAGWEWKSRSHFKHSFRSHVGHWVWTFNPQMLQVSVWGHRQQTHTEK